MPIFNLVVVPYLCVLVTIFALLELCRPASRKTMAVCYALPMLVVPAVLVGAYYASDMFREVPGAQVIPMLVWLAVGAGAVGAIGAAFTVAVFRRFSKHSSPTR